MATAYQNLKSGLEADVSIMVDNNFIDTHADIIEDIFLCIEFIRLGRKALSEKIWTEALKLYGFNSYRKIIDYMEKNIKVNDRATISIKKRFAIDRKQKLLKKYAYRLPQFKIKRILEDPNTKKAMEIA